MRDRRDRCGLPVLSLLAYPTPPTFDKPLTVKYTGIILVSTIQKGLFMRIPNMTRQELCDAVYRAVLGAGTPLTRLEIARAIGRKKSPHIVDMIEALTAGGWLSKIESTDKFGRPAYRYGVGANPANNEEACRQVA